MKLQFSHQDFQTKAVQSVVSVFDGQPLTSQEFGLIGESDGVEYGVDGSIGNSLHLSEEQLLRNVQAVQKANGLAPSATLVPSKSESGKEEEVFCPFNFTIEMETGTGKTYTYIKTIYELNKLYGFRKFVVVVPSVAIREGTVKNLEITRHHFAADYANVPLLSVLYDSGKLTELRHFAQCDALSVLVINIDSFTKDSKEDERKSNKINQKGEMAFAPIEYIRSVYPIVIVDEPQNFETDVRRRALANLNPLCTLRYSATPKNTYNLLFSLNPVQAYDLGLVKQIEVDGVLPDVDQNKAFVELLNIQASRRVITATVSIDVNDRKGSKRKEVILRVGDDLYVKSSMRDVYHDGYILNEIRADVGEVEFSGGRVLRLGDVQGDLREDVMRFQIERTVAAHFAKLKNLQPIGVKVLSLFFIDKVANYRSFDEEGNPSLGKFGVWFQEAFHKYANQPQYRNLIPHAVQDVHDGYFSEDRRGKGSQAKTVWVDSTGATARDDSTYQLIMKHKERLLDKDVPLQFIFSHSALREGWDNPNVFQICTLNDTKSVMKKRQEIGRGMRLCVNQEGERILDKRVNVLTVIANESYEAFAKSLQQEIEDDTGVTFTGRIQNARAKACIQRKSLTAEEDALFLSIWEKINYQTRYSVQLKTDKLIKRCVAALSDHNQYPIVRAPKIRADKGRILIRREGVEGMHIGTGNTHATQSGRSVPDVYAYIQNRVHLSRSTIFMILDQSGRMDELLRNAQAFLDMAISAIRTCLHELMVEGIQYHTLNGRRYEMTLFDQSFDAYLSSLYPPVKDELTTPIRKTLLQAQPIDEERQPKGEAFACVVSESETESRFAHDCTVDSRVKFFFKLPSRFKIPTPLGTYNPDWALVIEDDERVYFVTETKSTTVQASRRPAENLQIECGRKHFALNTALVFKDVTRLDDLFP